MQGVGGDPLTVAQASTAIASPSPPSSRRLLQRPTADWTKLASSPAASPSTAPAPSTRPDPVWAADGSVTQSSVMAPAPAQGGMEALVEVVVPGADPVRMYKDATADYE